MERKIREKRETLMGSTNGCADIQCKWCSEGPVKYCGCGEILCNAYREVLVVFYFPVGVGASNEAEVLSVGEALRIFKSFSFSSRLVLEVILLICSNG